MVAEAAKGRGHSAQLVYGCKAVPSPITAPMLIMTVQPILLYDPTSPTDPLLAWDTESYCSTAIHFTDVLPEYDAFALTRQISNPSLAATVDDSVRSLYMAAS